MKRMLMECISDITDIMIKKINSGADDITFIGLYEDAANVIKYLLTYDETLAYQINIEPVEWDGYEKEWLVTLDSDYNIWCEKAFSTKHNRYLYFDSNCTLVADDCNSAILKSFDSDEIFEVSYDFGNEDCYDEDVCDCENCEDCECQNESKESSTEVTRVAVNDKGVIKGFEKSWTTVNGNTTYYSTYSHYSNDQEMLKKLMDNFNIKL